MKKIILLFFAAITFSFSQEEHFQNVTPSQFRFSVAYGIAVMNPKEVNTHIATANTQMNSLAKSIKSMPELSGTLTIRPAETDAILVLRGGYLQTDRTYSFQVPQVDTSGISAGFINGNITETYSAYPLSVGVGLTNKTSTMQIHFEFIYALGYITEVGSYALLNGKRISYSRSLFSPNYGFRGAINVNVPVTKNIGVGLEMGYRYLNFDEFEDEVTAQSTPFEFAMSGILGGIRLNIDL
jgi:hypothetical protein